MAMTTLLTLAAMFGAVRQNTPRVGGGLVVVMMVMMVVVMVVVVMVVEVKFMQSKTLHTHKCHQWIWYLGTISLGVVKVEVDQQRMLFFSPDFAYITFSCLKVEELASSKSIAFLAQTKF